MPIAYYIARLTRRTVVIADDVQDYWIEELADVVCVDKEPKVVLSCKYSNPNGNVHWFKNHMEIFHGHKYNCKNENGTFRLIINRICLQDSGLYICQTDDKTTSADLTVEGMRISIRPALFLFDPLYSCSRYFFPLFLMIYEIKQY